MTDDEMKQLIAEVLPCDCGHPQRPVPRRHFCDCSILHRDRVFTAIKSLLAELEAERKALEGKP